MSEDTGTHKSNRNIHLIYVLALVCMFGAGLVYDNGVQKRIGDLNDRVEIAESKTKTMAETVRPTKELILGTVNEAIRQYCK